MRRLGLIVFSCLVAATVVLRVGAAKRRRIESRPNRETYVTELIGERGDGVTFVTNLDSGSASEGLLTLIAERLPAAVVVAAERDGLADALEEAGRNAKVLGVCGGDGSVRAAATIACRQQIPLAVVPGGTLNHFSRDLGIESVEDALSAIQQRSLMTIDLASCNDEIFVNTFAVGAYTAMVDARESIESRIGKWPAVLVALVVTLFRSKPLVLSVDGVERFVWLVFAGNGVYKPNGFAPGWRENLVDGLLDVRLVEGGRPLARVRLVAAVLSGRLGRSRVYQQKLVRQCVISGGESEVVRGAVDGETFDIDRSEFRLEKHNRALEVFALPG